MSSHDQKENFSGAAKPQRSFYGDNMSEPIAAKTKISESDAPQDRSKGWSADIESTLQLGEQFLGVVGGVVDLARAETLLAIRTLPKLMMLWLLIMPVILLTWCAFSALTAWAVFAVTEQVGFGMLAFFLLQVLLLIVCRLLFVKYRTRMTLPYTRAQIDNFVRSTKHGLDSRDKTQE